MNFDPVEFGKGVGEFVRKAISDAVAGLLSRLDALEARYAELKALPIPKDGKDGTSVTLEDVQPLIDEAVGEAVKAIPPALPGKDPEPVDVSAVAAEVLEPIKALAAEHLAALPVPQDGKSVTVEEVVKALAPLVDRSVSAWALDFERRAQDVLAAAASRIPVPKDGADGMGFEDIEIAHDGERRFCFRLSRDGQTKEFPFVLPAIIHRGLFVVGAPYEKGDAVTWGGSLWIASKDDPEGKPGESKDWSLASKRGRDGKSPA